MMYRVVYNLERAKIRVYKELDEVMVELVAEVDVDPGKCRPDYLRRKIEEIIKQLQG